MSTPHGAFPEDVEKILTDLETQIERLTKENKNLGTQLSIVSAEKEALQTQLTKLKLDISLMEYPDTTAEEDFHMLARASAINDAVGQAPAKVIEESAGLEDIEKVVDHGEANAQQDVVDSLVDFEIIGGDEYDEQS